MIVDATCTIAVEVNTLRLVQSYAPGTEINTATGYYGMSFKPAFSMHVIRLGIRAAAGNTGAHVVTVVDYAGEAIVARGTVDLTGSVPGHWYYADAEAA